MENLNEVRVKELRSDNGTEFRNHKLEELHDEKGISRNFSSPCTHEQNVIAERRNKILIKAARTISIIVKRHGKTAYDVFIGRSSHISYFHVFGCPVHIQNHKDHLGKFNEKADDGLFLGYSLVAKAFRVFNIRIQKMEETYHVTFSEDDEAISQSNTYGVTPQKSQCTGIPLGVPLHSIKYKLQKMTLKVSGPKVVFGDNSSGDTEGYGSVNCNGITFTRVAYVNCLKHNLINISQLYDDEYSRYTWVFCLQKKSGADDCIMSFIRNMENLNEVRVKELRSDNETEFKNHKLKEFCDEKGISQNFSSPCTLEQNVIAERRNKTLIEAARTMLNIANLPKQPGEKFSILFATLKIDPS
nr:retrovirus-related Pol polyprotein from transposon TNT 1-94 [Tanacetum cinerariifolium]